MASFNWKFLGYPALRIKDEIIRRMCVSFTASDGAVVNYKGKDELSGKLQYRGTTRGSGVQKPFKDNEHLSSDITGENSISNIIAVQDKYGLLSAVGLYGCFRCGSMVSAYLPKIIDIKGYAFERCSSLTSIYAPNTLSIGSSVFAECIKLQEANFPNVESIDRIAFYDCKQLRYVNIHNIENLKNDQQFNGCSMLSAIDMENVKSIGTWSFSKCKSLKCINTPKLISIGNKSFEGCTSISSVIIPNVSSFGDQTFYNCTNLKNIYLSNQDIPPTTGEDILSNITSKPTIWVKNETYKKYLTADYWKTEDISGHISSFTQPTVTFINPDTSLGDGGEALYEEVEYDLVKDGEQYVNTPSSPEVQIIVSNINEEQCTFQATEEGPTVTMSRDTTREQTKTGYRCYATAQGSRFGHAEVALKLAGTVLKTEKLNYGMSAEAPVISRPYYDFKGWDKPYVDVTEDVSCTAIFSKRLIDSTTTTLDMSSHIVTGTSADYEHTCDEINPGVSCMVDGVLTLLSNSIDYTLSYENNKVEWYDVNVGETRTQIAQVKVTGINYYSGMVSTDFTIGYTRNSSGIVTVTFDPCGGDYPAGPQQIEYGVGDTYGLCSEFNDLDTNARRGGHTFLGWFDVDGDTRVLSTDTIEKEQPYTLSAHWETNNYKLTISSMSDGWGKVNGHEISSKSPLICTDIEYNTVITLSAQPNFGYHFDHWGWGETLSVIDVLITSDTLKNVNFYPNEHTLNLVVVPENGGTALGPSTCKYRAHTSISAYANDGYKFSQWKSDNDVDISKDYPHEISVSRVYSREDNDITVSAMFDILTYTIIYDTDGGTATSNPTSYTVEDEITLLNDTTKENHEFLGWYDEGGNKITQITKGSSVGDRTISARWEKYPILIYDTGYDVETVLENQLYFEAQEENSTIKLENVAGTYKTSTNGTDWTDYELGTLCTLTNVGDKIYFSARSTNDTCWNDDYNTKFSMSGKIAAKGNIQYLLDSTGECLSVPDYCYSYMFSECTSLSSAPELPATTLANGCYSSMFNNCTSLTQAPVLSATTLANECYNSMFFNCTSLTQAPILPATTLANYCYYYMFSDCTSLTQAPVLSATTLAYGCYNNMFNNCTSLSSAPELPATTLANGCYSGMFNNCTSLTQAPVLSATTLSDYCYYDMFFNCSYLSVTTDQTKQGAYQILSVGSTTALEWGYDMFTGTAGDFTGTPTTGTPYYCWGN